jgi:hypothetical protein
MHLLDRLLIIDQPCQFMAKCFNNQLNQMFQLPYAYELKNTSEIAYDLSNLYIDNQHKMTTFDIKALYVKLPIRDIIQATKSCLYKQHIHPLIMQQTIALIHTILNQNYFQYNHYFYKSQTDIAMGSPLSSTATKSYLQYLEELLIKHWLESKHIIFYRRYVDDMIITHDQQKNTIEHINETLNQLNSHLTFTYTLEMDDTIAYLDLTIHRYTSC